MHPRSAGHAFQGGICSGAARRRPEEGPAVGPRQASFRTFFPPFATPHVGRLDIRKPTSVGMLASSGVFVDFRRFRMPGLPMLNDRRGSEGSDPATEAQDDKPQPSCLSLPDRPTAGTKDQSHPARHKQGAHRAYSRLLTAGACATTQSESIGEPAMKVFTTGQVAKICKVAPRTVS